MTLTDFLDDPPPPAPKPRPRDEIWDALLALFPAPVLTKTQRGAYNAAVKELKQLGATPAEIRRRAERWGHVFPRATLTPNALVKHWHRLVTGTTKANYGPNVPPPEDPAVATARREKELSNRITFKEAVARGIIKPLKGGA